MHNEDFVFVMHLCVVENCIEKGQLVQMSLIIIPAVFSNAVENTRRKAIASIVFVSLVLLLMPIKYFDPNIPTISKHRKHSFLKNFVSLKAQTTKIMTDSNEK